MKKELIIFAVILWLFGMCLYSCGARKSETTKKEETTKTDFSGIFRDSGNSHEILKTDLNLQTNYNSKFLDLSKSTSYKFTFQPEDTSKPGIYTDPNGNKHIVENGKLISENSTEEKNISSGNSWNSQQILKSELDKKSNYILRLETQIKEIKRLSDKNKITTNDGFSFWNYFLLFIPIGLMLVAWKVYKNLNPLS